MERKIVRKMNKTWALVDINNMKIRIHEIGEQAFELTGRHKRQEQSDDWSIIR